MLFERNGSPRLGDQARGHAVHHRHHHEEGHGPAHAGGHHTPAHGRHRGGGFGGPARGRTARRGDVRAAILTLLAEQPMHGYQVISELDARTEGRWRPSAGSIYPTLQQLDDEGLVRSEEVDGRRVFRLTEAGVAENARRGEAAGAPWAPDATSDDDPAFELRRLTFAVGAAAMQVAEVGSVRSLEQARALLSDTRRRLYRLLADDDAPATAAPATTADGASLAAPATTADGASLAR